MECEPFMYEDEESIYNFTNSKVLRISDNRT